MLRDSKVIVLDEATSNIDYHTDHIIQNTIDHLFKNKTVLIVAHRLATIINCDYILLLNEGEVMEFDAPYKLLEKEDGYFTHLVDQTGEESSAQLKAIALENKKNKKQN